MVLETYRLWIIWGQNRQVVIFPILALTGAFGMLLPSPDRKLDDAAGSRMRRSYSRGSKAKTSGNFSHSLDTLGGRRGWALILVCLLSSSALTLIGFQEQIFIALVIQ
jgi:hypothetical protein